jgi:hypothetical protein
LCAAAPILIVFFNYLPTYLFSHRFTVIIAVIFSISVEEIQFDLLTSNEGSTEMRISTLRSLARAPAAAAALAIVGFSSAQHPRESAARLEAPSFTERTVGNYENRLRKFSSPERVFEYFSSVEIDKQFFMTRDDLARAVTPYTYRSGAPLSSKNYKYNLMAIKTKPSKVHYDKSIVYRGASTEYVLDSVGGRGRV